MARKFIELRSGCMAKAAIDEPTFVLLGRDVCAPLAIKAWIEARVLTGKNTRNDAQIRDAEEMISLMEHEQAEWHLKSRNQASPPIKPTNRSGYGS